MPSSVKEVQQFLGMVNFYRKYIKDYAKKAKLLATLMGKFVKFKWSNEAEDFFQTLKNHLQQAPILAHPDVKKPYLLYCDASDVDVGGGGCLSSKR